MDANQYKDYVLVLLFIMYVSDKYAGLHYAPIAIPGGASFLTFSGKDMVALKGVSDIGDQINLSAQAEGSVVRVKKKIIAPLGKANKLADMPDFNDSTKLGDGKDLGDPKDKVDRLTNLIAIFENKALDFPKNRARMNNADDILGDACEYLTRHVAPIGS